LGSTENSEHASFAVVYHPLDGILNLFTKFEVRSVTKLKFRERVPKYITDGHMTIDPDKAPFGGIDSL